MDSINHFTASYSDTFSSSSSFSTFPVSLSVAQAITRMLDHTVLEKVLLQGRSHQEYGTSVPHQTVLQPQAGHVAGRVQPLLGQQPCDYPSEIWRSEVLAGMHSFKLLSAIRSKTASGFLQHKEFNAMYPLQYHSTPDFLGRVGSAPPILEFDGAVEF